MREGWDLNGKANCLVTACRKEPTGNGFQVLCFYLHVYLLNYMFTCIFYFWKTELAMPAGLLMSKCQRPAKMAKLGGLKRFGRGVGTPGS